LIDAVRGARGRLKRRSPDPVVGCASFPRQSGVEKFLSGLMPRSRRAGLQLDHRAPDAQPDELPVGFATIQHFVGASCRGQLGIVAVLADQQAGGTPYIVIGDYGPLRPAPRCLPRPKDRASSLRRIA
jgi:hypothetical protein